MKKDGKRIVYRAFSPSRNPDISKVYYDRIDAEMDVRRRNAGARIISPVGADYVLQGTEVNWMDDEPEGDLR